MTVYEDIDAVNWSTLKHIGGDGSPKHYRHAVDEERKDTDAMLVGRATHTVVFEPREFGKRYAIWTGGRRASKLWDEFVDELDGREALTEKQVETAKAVGKAVRSHPAAMRILEVGVGEGIAQWTDPVTGIDCKGRIDWQRPRLVCDLKTTQSVLPRLFRKAVGNYSYHGQAAFYCDGSAAMTGEQPAFAFIAVESKAPYDVGVFALPNEALEVGRMLYRGHLMRLAECLETDTWPGRSDEIQRLELPGWAYTQDL